MIPFALARTPMALVAYRLERILDRGRARLEALLSAQASAGSRERNWHKRPRRCLTERKSRRSSGRPSACRNPFWSSRRRNGRDMDCPHCQNQLMPGTAQCARCGHAVPTQSLPGDWQTPPPGRTNGVPEASRHGPVHLAVPLLVVISLVAFIGIGATGFFFVQNRDTAHKLDQARTTLTNTNSQLAATSRQLDSARQQASSLSEQVRNLQSELSDAQGQLHASEQLGSQIAAVADSLRNCINLTNIFQQGFSAEMSGGYFSSVVTEEATEADAACNQANADYQALESELKLAGAAASA